MTRFDSLYQLVHSLSKAEKKRFKIYSSHTAGSKDYLALFDLIEHSREQQQAPIRQQYRQVCPSSSFESAVAYLYKVLLDNLLSLRMEQDTHSMLCGQLLKARMLFEKALYESSLEIVREVKSKAAQSQNYYALLLAQRMELDYLMVLGLGHTTEQELLGKQLQLNDTLNILRKINQQTSLYELLKHRTIHQGSLNRERQIQELNDLVVSEMSINATFSFVSFEATKMHQLFQASYLIAVGDYKSALRSYSQLVQAFDQHRHLWSHPPVYYLLALEGILKSLRSIRDYAGMPYFVGKLGEIQEVGAQDFKLNVLSLVFQYQWFTHLDNGRFDQALQLYQQYTPTLIDKMHLLGLSRRTELHFYAAVMYLGLGQLSHARQHIKPMISHKGDTYLPLHRAIKLLSIAVRYQMADYEGVQYEVAALRRQQARGQQRLPVDQLVMQVAGLLPLPTQAHKEHPAWAKVAPHIQAIRLQGQEQALLGLFDFVAWCEAVLRKVPLATVLQQERTSNEAQPPTGD